MGQHLDQIEQQRLVLQVELDAQKSQAERNRLGQFATPTALARDILNYAASLLGSGERIHFLDPAIGTGAFYSALCAVVPQEQIAEAIGFEIDSHYGQPAASLWKNFGLVIDHCDFTRAKASPRFNIIICNPPYVRHHHLQNGDKNRLQLRTRQLCGMKLSGLAGLYCHFLGLSHAWMADGGIAAWLVPSEFMDVNYGQEVKRYLLDRVTLLRVHRFDPNDVQFADALVSSAIVCFRKLPPTKGHAVTFTFGGTLVSPKLSRVVSAGALSRESKWTRFPIADIRDVSEAPTLSEYFQIKRGIATGDNGYFILSEEEINSRGLPMEFFSPILPSPRYLTDDVVTQRPDGTPDIERRLFLLDTRLSEEQIQRRFPTLYSYLEEGRARKLHERYLCRHRSIWYAQEHRPPAPIVCTYLGRGDTKRGRPFRFILNNSRATIANVYLAMYPTAKLASALEHDARLVHEIWNVLNNLRPDELLREGRVYGGGLHKLEPRELGNVSVPGIAALLPDFERPTRQHDLLAELVN